MSRLGAILRAAEECGVCTNEEARQIAASVGIAAGIVLDHKTAEVPLARAAWLRLFTEQDMRELVGE